MQGGEWGGKRAIHRYAKRAKKICDIGQEASDVRVKIKHKES